jgi:hypothetical protein
MSWLYSRALVEASLAGTYSDGELYVLSNSMPIAQAYLSPDRMKAFSRLSRFGMTFEPLTDDVGADLLTWCRAAFPVRTYPSQEREQESKENSPDSGWKWPGSFAKYDPATRSWRTRQCSLLGGLTEFSETWPRWGLMQDGESSVLPTLVRPTNESGSGLLPTPTATDYKGSPTSTLGSRMDHSRGVRLEEHLKRQLLPTPTAGNWHSAGRMDEWGGKNWTRGLEIGRLHLNPSLVEEMMSFPLGWTGLKPLGMLKFRLWRQQHGDC